MMDFNSALDTQASAVEKPPVMPQGTYVWGVSKIPALSVSKSGEWNIVEFPIRGVSAEDDVDPEELQAFGAATSAMNRISFMSPTEEGPEGDASRAKMMYQLKRFMEETLRVDVEDGATLREMMNASINCQFMAQAVWNPSDDGQETYINVKNYAPLD
jgi:hypothetical protein